MTITICAIALGALLGAGAHSTGLRPHRARNETAAAVSAARLPAHPAVRHVSNPPPHHVAPTPASLAVAGASQAQGSASPAVGGASQAQGSASPAVGGASQAQGSASPAVGGASEAQGSASPAVGGAPEAQGPASPAVGGASEAQGPATPVAGAPEAQGPATPVAGELEAQGHDLLQSGSYPEAVTVLRRAVSATGERLSECLQPSTATCLTYAYALYDLGQALRLEGQPAAAVPILKGRLEINNQRSTVQAALQLARKTTG
ncbi:MAG: hypothetical protein ACLP0J_29700 [Solirubrobacteraceae bacterium]